METIRTADGPRQRTLCYLGELNGSAHARWQKTIEAFNEHRESTQLELFSSEAEAPDDPNVARGVGEEGPGGASAPIRRLLSWAGVLEAVGAR